MYIFIGFWTLYTVMKENGLLPKKSVKGKHIFITGAGSGLGQQMAIRLSKLGANVTVSDIRLDGTEKTKSMILLETGRDNNVFSVELDVSNR